MASSLREYLRPSESMLFVNDLVKHAKPSEVSTLLTTPPRSAGASVAVAAGTGLAGAAREQSLYELIREKQRSIENEQWNVGVQKRRMEELELEAASCTKRHELRRKRDCLQALDSLREDVRQLETGEKLSDFRQQVQPYLNEYQKQQFCRSRWDEPQPPLLPSKEQSVVEDYLSMVDAQPPKFLILNGDACQACSEPLRLHQTLSMLICPRCGLARPYLDATASLMSYSDDYDCASFSYKRISHFEEFLRSLQGNESVEVPAPVLEAVMQRLLDERTTDPSEITVHRVRDVLKKLKYRKFYEHATLIACKITGRPAPKMTPEMEERIKVCFLAASAAFQRHIHAFENRKNMISYATVTAKLCEILGYREFLPYFAPLKSREKLAKADECWRMICHDLGWPFLPSPQP